MSDRISFNPLSVVLVLAEVSVLLIFLSLEGQWIAYVHGWKEIPGIVQLFNVGEELNIPTLFSAFLLSVAAVLLAFIAALEKNRNAFGVSYWVVLSGGFFLMTADELCYFHERLTDPMQVLLGGDNLGIFHFAWIVPAIVLVIFLSLFFLKFLLCLPSKTAVTFLIAGILFISGSIGLELIGGRHVEIYGSENLMYTLLETIEEGLEMTGIIIFIWGLMNYMADNYKTIMIRFDGVHGTDE